MQLDCTTGLTQVYVVDCWPSGEGCVFVDGIQRLFFGLGYRITVEHFTRDYFCLSLSHEVDILQSEKMFSWPMVH